MIAVSIALCTLIYQWGGNGKISIFICTLMVNAIIIIFIRESDLLKNALAQLQNYLRIS
jgi:hypothetical protein